MTTTQGEFKTKGWPFPAPRALKTIIIVLATFGIFVVAAAAINGRPIGEWVRVGTVAEVRSEDVLNLERAKVFVVAEARGFLAFSAVNPHLGHPIKYCPTSGWFEDPVHGEKFDRLGYYRVGPAPRGMDRVLLKVVADEVFINPSHVTHGAPRGSGRGPEPKGAFCVGAG